MSTGSADRAAAPARPVTGGGLLVLAILLTGLNLRTAVTTVGPLLAELGAGLGMSSTVAGLLTTLPVICFAGLGVLTPAATRRFGEFATLGAGLAVMTVGMVARALAGSSGMFLLMSVLALAGGAVGNVALPGVVKRHFPNRTGLVVAGYSTALALGQAAGAAFAVPIAHLAGAGGWRLGLGAWAVVSAVAVLPWVALLATAGRAERPADPADPTDPADPADPAGPAGPADGDPADPAVPAVPGDPPADPAADRWPGPRALARSPLAWALTVFFGCQSAVAYIAFGWFAQLFRDAGVSADRAGLLAAIVSVLAIPVSLVVPTAAARMRTQRPLVLGLVGCEVVGFLGMLLAPVAAGWLWMVLIGIGMGLFPLALTLFALRARTARATAALSAFAQGIGYVIAAAGPLLVGVLRDVTGQWHAPFVVLFALAALMIPVGWYSAGDRTVDDDLPARRPVT